MRVEDIFEAIDAITLAESVMSAHQGNDRITVVCIDAITYRVFTIGEAVKALSPEAKDGHSNVPWSKIAKMRDFIGHHYYRRDPEIIFATIREPLKQLREACEQIAAATSDQLVGGEQDTPFEHKGIGVWRDRQPRQESPEGIQPQVLGARSAALLRQSSQGKVGATLGGRVRGARGTALALVHRRASRAARIGGVAAGKRLAVLRRSAGSLPRRRSQRRSASYAVSGPSSLRIRNASTMLRGASNNPMGVSRSTWTEPLPTSNVVVAKLCQLTMFPIRGCQDPLGRAMSCADGISSVKS